MRTTGLVALGAVMAVVGLVWTLQGLGELGGSPMTDVAFWAYAGGVVGALGVVLMVLGLRR